MRKTSAKNEACKASTLEGINPAVVSIIAGILSARIPMELLHNAWEKDIMFDESTQSQWLLAIQLVDLIIKLDLMTKYLEVFLLEKVLDTIEVNQSPPDFVWS